MTARRMFALALALAVCLAGTAAAQNPNPGSGKGTSTTAPGSEKRPDATNERLTTPPEEKKSGVTPGGGKTGTVPTTPGHDTTGKKKTDEMKDPKTTGQKK